LKAIKNLCFIICGDIENNPDNAKFLKNHIMREHKFVVFSRNQGLCEKINCVKHKMFDEVEKIADSEKDKFFEKFNKVKKAIKKNDGIVFIKTRDFVEDEEFEKIMFLANTSKNVEYIREVKFAGNLKKKYSFMFKSGDLEIEYIPESVCNNEMDLSSLPEEYTFFEKISNLQCGDIRLLAYEFLKEEEKDKLGDNAEVRIKVTYE